MSNWVNVRVYNNNTKVTKIRTKAIIVRRCHDWMGSDTKSWNWIIVEEERWSFQSEEPSFKVYFKRVSTLMNYCWIRQDPSNQGKNLVWLYFESVSTLTINFNQFIRVPTTYTFFAGHSLLIRLKCNIIVEVFATILLHNSEARDPISLDDRSWLY